MRVDCVVVAITATCVAVAKWVDLIRETRRSSSLSGSHAAVGWVDDAIASHSHFSTWFALLDMVLPNP
jgi:hypothetical protein